MVQMDGHVVVAERASPLVAAAAKLVGRIEALVVEVERLRAENAELRQEIWDAVSLFEGAARREGRRAPSARRAPPHRSVGRRRRGHTVKGRATPAEVTSEVVRAVIAKLGEATASQIAAEITAAGAPVGGRAVRFLAERAGAATRVGDDGQRRYRLG